MNNKSLIIPERVEVLKDKKNDRFPNSKIFFEKPKGYIISNSLGCFKKNDSTYIQGIEIPDNTDFTLKKERINEEFKKEKGTELYYKKEFELGEYKAIILYGADNKKYREQVVLLFGNSSRACMVVAGFDARDEDSKREIIESILTCYYQEDFIFHPLDLAKFEIDISKSHFKFNTSISNQYYYSINGNEDVLHDSIGTFILVMTLPAVDGKEGLKRCALAILDQYKTKIIQSIKYTEELKKINSNYAYEIKCSGKTKGVNTNTYIFVTGDEKETIVLIGNSDLRQGNYIDEFSKVALTLKTK